MTIIRIITIMTIITTMRMAIIMATRIRRRSQTTRCIRIIKSSASR